MAYINRMAHDLLVDSATRVAWLLVSKTKHEPLPYATDIAHAMLWGNWGVPLPVDVLEELKRRGARLDGVMSALTGVMEKVALVTPVLARTYCDAAGVFARAAYTDLETMDRNRKKANQDLRAMETSQECLPPSDICRLLQRGGNPYTALKCVLATTGPKSSIRDAVRLITKGTSARVTWNPTLVSLASHGGHEEVVPEADLQKFRPPARSERKRPRTQKAGLAAAAKAPSAGARGAKKKKRRGVARVA